MNGGWHGHLKIVPAWCNSYGRIWVANLSLNPIPNITVNYAFKFDFATVASEIENHPLTRCFPSTIQVPGFWLKAILYGLKKHIGCQIWRASGLEDENLTLLRKVRPQKRLIVHGQGFVVVIDVSWCNNTCAFTSAIIIKCVFWFFLVVVGNRICHDLSKEFMIGSVCFQTGIDGRTHMGPGPLVDLTHAGGFFVGYQV